MGLVANELEDPCDISSTPPGSRLKRSDCHDSQIIIEPNDSERVLEPPPMHRPRTQQQMMLGRCGVDAAPPLPERGGDEHGTGGPKPSRQFDVFHHGTVRLPRGLEQGDGCGSFRQSANVDRYGSRAASSAAASSATMTKTSLLVAPTNTERSEGICESLNSVHASNIS